MDGTLTAVVLAAAVMHAAWNALVKSSADRLLELTALNFFSGLFALAALPFVGLPGAAALPYLLGSMLVHIAYYALLLRSYDSGGLSLVYPIARGTSPVLVAAASGLLLEESLGGAQWFAVAVIAASIMSLAFAGGIRQLSKRAVGFSVLTGLSIATYTVVDGAGARAADKAVSYIAALFVLNAFPMIPLGLHRRRGLALGRLRAQWKTAALGGALSALAYGLAIWAMTRGSVALVSALRETSVVMAALIGALFLHEPFGRARVLASVGVAAGVVVLRLAA